MELYFATFANESWGVARNRIRREAEAMGVFKEVFVYGESDLDAGFREKHAGFVRAHPRGYGAYVWKPQVVFQALGRMPEGAVLLYADAGCVLNKEGVGRLLEYAEMVAAHPSGILGFNITYPMEEWTKREVIEHYGLTAAERRAPQHAGGIHLTHNVPAGRAFITQWRDDCERYELISDFRRLPAHPEFRDHRHDQSVFSILFHRHGGLSLPDETWWEPVWESKKHYPVHARRLRGI